jgi:ribosomal protein S4
MRLKNKYKVYTQTVQTSETFHKRLLNFKRPKWKKLQKALSFSINAKKLISNNFYIKNTYKSWDKVKSYFKQGTKSKSNVYCHFDNSINVHHLNKTIKKKQAFGVRDLFVDCLLKPEFRIDILLWRLHFFNSSYQARQFLNS